MSDRQAYVERRRVELRALVPNGNTPPASDPGTVGPPTAEPGEVGALEISGEFGPYQSTQIVASPWSGWPAEWATPVLATNSRLGELVDTAWAALDLNASILSTMPPYRVRNEAVLDAPTWMSNPDPDLYTSWEEFAKQLFWDFQMGEAFVLATAYDAAGWPARFHVIPPWLVNVEMSSGRRQYTIGAMNVTDDVLHIRYKSTTDDARGHGPLEAGNARLIAAGALARYATTVARGGGVPHSAIVSQAELTSGQADALLHQWLDRRLQHLGAPAVLSGGVDIKTLSFSPKDMALLELSQFNESRISVLLGVPPFLLGLPSGGDSLTYSTTTSLFDFHWRAGLRPKASPVMAALSGWALPRGQRVELNRDEYIRPGFGERVNAWAVLHGIEDETGRAITAAEIREGERLTGNESPAILTGGT